LSFVFFSIDDEEVDDAPDASPVRSTVIAHHRSAVVAVPFSQVILTQLALLKEVHVGEETVPSLGVEDLDGIRHLDFCPGRGLLFLITRGWNPFKPREIFFFLLYFDRD
jgi:hypothetical protein